MRRTSRSDFKENIAHYKKGIWLRLPGVFMVGSILAQHDGLFHYVGITFIVWAMLDLVFYLYRKRTDIKERLRVFVKN